MKDEFMHIIEKNMGINSLNLTMKSCQVNQMLI